MVSYKIVLGARAEKEPRKLARPIRLRVANAIDALGRNPRPSAARKMVGSGGYRLRVGDYRVIYEIEDNIVAVYIIKIGHRREIYRR